MPEVLSREGVPIVSDFAGGKGTPLVVDTDTARGYVLIDNEVTPLNDHTVNVLDYPSVQAAIDAAGSGGHVTIPPGTYPLTDTLTFTNLKNIEFGGNGGSGDTELNTVFVWNGSNDGTVMLLDRTRDSYFHGFTITAGTGTIGIGIRIDHVDPPVTSLSTHNMFERVTVGASTTGIQIGNSSVANNDIHHFRDVYVRGSGTYGYYINNAQTKLILIDGGAIEDRSYGVYHNAGSFRIRETTFSQSTTADIRLGQPTDTILVSGVQSETAPRFLIHSGASSAKWAVTITGCRLAHNGLHADGEYIQFLKGGPFNLIGNDFSDGQHNAAWLLRVDAPGTGILNSVGNIFPNATPFVGSPILHNMGSAYIGASDTPANMDSTFTFPVVATADLPAGATALNGRTLIEDAGAGDRNLILYAGGQRFRIDGGAAF